MPTTWIWWKTRNLDYISQAPLWLKFHRWADSGKRAANYLSTTFYAHHQMIKLVFSVASLRSWAISTHSTSSPQGYFSFEKAHLKLAHEFASNSEGYSYCHTPWKITKIVRGLLNYSLRSDRLNNCRVINFLLSFWNSLPN